MKADLHVHTNFSDGSTSITETIQLAKQNGLTHISFVDHDTVNGTRVAMEIGSKEGIIVIPGIEISAYDFNKNRKVHILGYNYDLEAVNIKKICDPLLERRHKNSLWQMEQLLKNGYDIDINHIVQKAETSRVIYKQHIMEELIEKSYTDTIYSALYKKLFKNDGICARDIQYIDAIEAVKAIKADNGIAILAHPGQLDSYHLIDKLVDVGLDGIELYHPDHKQSDINNIVTYKNKYNDLILTGGSDFHGNYGSSSTQFGDILCPTDYLDIIKLL